jgi:hypothetical protein
MSTEHPLDLLDGRCGVVVNQPARQPKNAITACPQILVATRIPVGIVIPRPVTLDNERVVNEKVDTVVTDEVLSEIADPAFVEPSGKSRFDRRQVGGVIRVLEPGDTGALQYEDEVSAAHQRVDVEFPGLRIRRPRHGGELPLGDGGRGDNRDPSTRRLGRQGACLLDEGTIGESLWSQVRKDQRGGAIRRFRQLMADRHDREIGNPTGEGRVGGPICNEAKSCPQVLTAVRPPAVFDALGNGYRRLLHRSMRFDGTATRQ